MPTGYKKVEEIRTGSSVTVLYENEEEDIIYFHYSYMFQGSVLGVSTEHTEVYEVNVHNCFGHFYLSTDPKDSNTVVWLDDQKEIKFFIDGFFSKDDLLAMAESIELCNVTK